MTSRFIKLSLSVFMCISLILPWGCEPMSEQTKEPGKEETKPDNPENPETPETPENPDNPGGGNETKTVVLRLILPEGITRAEYNSPDDKGVVAQKVEDANIQTLEFEGTSGSDNIRDFSITAADYKSTKYAYYDAPGLIITIFNQDGSKSQGVVVEENLLETGMDTLKVDMSKLELIDRPTKAVNLGDYGKWAPFNVGAKADCNSAEEAMGNYYAWGEIEPKTDFTPGNYKFNGQSDFHTYLHGTQYDVARVKWGKEWRMPTYSEFNALLPEGLYLTEIQYGNTSVTGLKFKEGGEEMVLPNLGRPGNYFISSNFWTSAWGYRQSTSSNSIFAYQFSFHNSGHDLSAHNGYLGYNVRAKAGSFIPQGGHIVANSITLDKTVLEIAPDEIDELSATLSPQEYTTGEVYWKSSDENVLKAEKLEGLAVHKCKLTALKEGNVTVTVAYYAGETRLSASCEVTVKISGNVRLELPAGVTQIDINVPDEQGKLAIHAKDSKIQTIRLKAPTSKESYIRYITVPSVDYRQAGLIMTVFNEDRSMSNGAMVSEDFSASMSKPVDVFIDEGGRLHDRPDASEAIDMGSAGKWAAYNVGAFEDQGSDEALQWINWASYGRWIGFGEIEASIMQSPYSYMGGFAKGSSESTFPEYCGKAGDPIFDAGLSDIAGTKFDFARVLWGKGWCLPTKNKLETLIKSSTKKEAAFVFGKNTVRGYEFTIGGNTVFLPYNHISKGGGFVQGMSAYWSSAICESDPSQAWCAFLLHGGTIYLMNAFQERPRWLGFHIRAVVDTEAMNQ